MAKTKVHGEFLKDSVVRFTAKAGENITKGQAVYISGISGEVPVVSLADANDTAKMPAFGLAEATVSTNAEVEITSFGTLKGLDTSSYSLGDILYVDTTAGALTNNPSGLEATKLQNIGMVQRVHASSGSIKVGGAGRTNAVPNLDDGDIFIGDSNNKAISSSFTAVLNSEAGINSSADATAITINSSENVGIGNSNPDTKLTVGTFGNTARAAAFNGGSILIDGGAASEIIIGDGNVAYMSIQTTDNATAMKIRNFSGSSDLVTIERATGNVGIGETNPDASLHITSNTPIISFDESDAGQEYRIGSFGGSFALYDSTDSAYRLVVDGSGAVGIGVTSILQGYKLEVAGHIVIPSGNFLANRSAGGSNWGLIRGNDSGTTILGDSQSLQITASGNVGIGETTPDDTLHVNNAGGAARIRIGSGNDAYYTQKGYLGDTWVFGSGETGDVVTSTISGGAFTSSNTGGAFVWKIATSGGTPAEKMRIKSDGQITTQGDILPGADVIMANGRGISFTATANSSGSMSNELLDDYEEGTFTMQFHNNGTNPTVASVENTTAHYTKIGNTVRFMFYSGAINISNIGTGSARLTGLPFNSLGGSYSYSPVTFAHTTAFDSGPTGYTVTGSNYIQCTDALPATAGCQYVTGTRFIMVSGVYQTS